MNPSLKELHALVSMIDEPDEKVYQSLKEKVLSYEMEAVLVLEQAWMAATDLLVVSRLEDLLDEINFRLVYNDLKNWIETGSVKLHSAMLLINKLENKDLEKSKYQKNLELLYRDAWLEMNDNLTALEKTKVLNHIFFTVHQYNSQPTESENIQNFFISNLFDAKEGNATSMGMLYLSIAQYLKLPVFGVNLPGHLILAFIDDRHFIKEQVSYKREDVLFYINPFNGGAVFTENEIDLYIKQVKLESKEHYYLPTTNKSIIKRYLQELQKAYQRQDNENKQDSVKRLLKLF